MRSKRSGLLLAAAVAFAFARATAQDAPVPTGPKLGPYEVPKHWSKYKYPESIPDAAAYHIIEKGDTLWDLAGKYLKRPLLWPQIWDDNKYITDAHWIYPGDPIVLKKVEIVAETAGQAVPTTPAGAEDVAAAARQAGAGAEGPTENPLYPATEAVTMQCAPQIQTAGDDQSLKIVASEQGRLQISYSDRDILYLNKGSNAGIKPGDTFSIHRAGSKVKHPKTGKTLGTKVITKGWLRVILAQETSSTAVVEQACTEISAGEYLKPFEKVSVPLVLRRPPADRLSPPSGKAQGYVVHIGLATGHGLEEQVAAAGHLLFVDLGSQTGVAPGNLLTAFRLEDPKTPSSRHVLGQLAILSVKENVALAKILYSADMVQVGDQVEVR